MAEAQAHDDEIARAQAAAMTGGELAPASRSFLDWTPETELLTFVGDILNQLVAITVAVNSKDGQMKQPAPLPRPTRALDAMLLRVRDELADAWIAEIEQGRPGGEV